MNNPSAIFLETPEQRAANTRAIGEATGLSDAVLECVVRSFYGTAREDPILAPLFAHVADWQSVSGAKVRADLMTVHTVPQSDAKKWRKPVLLVPISSVCCTCVPGLLPLLQTQDGSSV